MKIKIRQISLNLLTKPNMIDSNWFSVQFKNLKKKLFQVFLLILPKIRTENADPWLLAWINICYLGNISPKKVPSLKGNQAVFHYITSLLESVVAGTF